MKIPKLKMGDYVEIIWADACCHEDGSWMFEDELLEREAGMPIITVGIYLQQKGGCIMLCGERHDRTGYKARAARCFDIPVGCITEIHKLRR